MIASTQAAVLQQSGRPLVIRELKLPPLRPGQVLVEMAYSGVCGTQILEVRGRKGPDRFLPHTLGHEGSGVVLEVGEGVEKVKAGDHVVLTWIKGAGADVPSTVYDSEAGPVNSGAISTFMRHTITCENRVVPIAHEMPLREAALLGCAIPTGAGIIFNTARIVPGCSVAIFGIGGVGGSALMAAAAAGAQPIFAVDIHAGKRVLAEKLGATRFIHADQGCSEEEIRALTQGRGVDVAVETAGQRVSMESAFASVRDQGGLCVLAGNLPHGERISIDPFDLIKGRRIVGTWGGETDPDRDVPNYAAMFLEDSLPLSRMLTREFLLDDVNEALKAVESGEMGRVLLRMKVS